MTPEPTRNVAIGVMAAVVSLVCLGGIVWALTAWWSWRSLLLLVFVPLGLVCAYGVDESFKKVPRDAKGNQIR
jgi:MFS family permease